jgi:2,4-dienoyl-CoA reductase-like NADH-dependent reductase (Old Yellow Enzyme family)
MIDAPRLAPLFQEGRIGTLVLRNRILMCPMGDSLANPDGTVSTRQQAYYGARARGGAALIILGSVGVAYPAGSFAATQTAASHDNHIAGLRELADGVHAHDAAIAAQLVHGGPNSLLDIATGRPLLVASLPRYRQDQLSGMVTSEERSAMAAPMSQSTSKYDPRAATERDLELVIEQFASSAERAQRAGFDGIELHAGHGYLLDTFRSAASNHRDDRWGGSLDNRLRLLMEVIAAVRARVGPAFPLWCRLNAVEHFRDDGETLDETLIVAERAVVAGLDAIHVTAYADPGVGIGVTEAHTPARPGALLEYARAIKARIAVPVITFGRLEPEAAAGCIADGTADFVAMGRKLLADPDLPNKLRAGRIDDIRPCIYQYRCIGNIFVGGSVACVANPSTAREELLAPSSTVQPRRALVIGGGPAGMETARLLSASGHDVRLWEASRRLGGALAIGARTDESLDRMLRWQLRQLERSAVTVELGRRASVEEVQSLLPLPEIVVVATGADWEQLDLPNTSSAPARTLATLADWADGDDHSLGARLAIIGGGKVGCSLAQLAVSRGHIVTLIEPSGVFAAELGLPGRFRLVHDLEEAGVRLLAATPLAINPAGVDCGTELVEADTVVNVAGTQAAPVLLDALRIAGIDARGVGDCVDVGKLEGAFLGAALLAKAIV